MRAFSSQGGSNEKLLLVALWEIKAFSELEIGCLFLSLSFSYKPPNFMEVHIKKKKKHTFLGSPFIGVLTPFY